MAEVRVEYRGWHKVEDVERVKRVIREAIAVAKRRLGYEISPAIALLAGLDRYCAYLKSYRRNKARTIAVRRKRLVWWSDFLCPDGGDIGVDRITMAMVDAGVARLSERLAPGTVNSYLSALKGYGKWAISRGLAGADRLDWMSVERCVVMPVAHRAMTPKEFRMMMAAWPASGVHVARVLWMMIFSGARPEALRRLKVRDVRVDNKTGRGRIPIARLKGGRLEVVTFMRDSAIDRVLTGARDDFVRFYGRAPKPSDPVFVPMPTAGRGTEVVQGWTTPDMLSHAVKFHAEKAVGRCHGDGLDHFVAYTARHSILTWLAQENVCDELRARFAGHTNTRQQAQYVHLSGEDGREIRELVDDQLGGMYDSSMARILLEKGDPETLEPGRKDLQFKPLVL